MPARASHSGLMLAARITLPHFLDLFGDELGEVGRRAREHHAS